MEGLGILAGVLLLGGGVFGWLRVRRQIRLFSLALFGTSSLKEGLERQADILGEVPKSVSGMTKLCLPQIEADFPGFQWAQWKQRCENLLRAYLRALESQDLSGLESGQGQDMGVSDELLRQAEHEIQEQRRRGVREEYRQVRIHQTEIARYQKEAGLCIIRLQSAVEYYYQEKEQESAGPQKEQNRFNMELIYVQDISKAGDYATAIGATCPNCGAPVTRLGSKFCEYCGTGIIPIDIRVWKLHRIEKE